MDIVMLNINATIDQSIHFEVAEVILCLCSINT
jgi:hypothetical protein